MGVLAVAASSIFVASTSANANGAFVSGTVIIDAQNFGTQPGARRGEVDGPLEGATVTLLGSDPSHPGWSTVTDAAGAWTFPTGDYGASPGPYHVVIDVEGAGDDLYVTALTSDFTPQDGAPQVSVSREFGSDVQGVVLDAQVIPAWRLGVALYTDANGVGGKSVLTGSDPFDGDDVDGHDSSASNTRVRTGDVLSTTWSVALSGDVTVGGIPGHTYFEQTLTLGKGARANFADLPVACDSAILVATGPSSPAGQEIGVRDEVPAGTEAVTMTCDLGSMDGTAAKMIPTSVWVSASSAANATFSTSARAYAVDGADRVLARPSSDEATVPITISAAPRYDLRKWAGPTLGQRFVEFGGVSGVEVVTEQALLTISTDVKRGVEAFTQPITIDEDFWATFTDTAGQHGKGGTLLNDLQYEITSCEPSAMTVDGAVTGLPVAKQPGSAVAGTGSCDITRDDPTDLTSGYSLTFSGIDTTSGNYPTRAIGGADLTAGPFYVAAFKVIINIPVSEFDRAQGAPNDFVGELALYNRVGKFDVVGASGAKNYSGAEEPGYCEQGPAADRDTRCERMDDESRSNNVIGPRIATIKKMGFDGWNYQKGLADPSFAWRSGSLALPGWPEWGAGQALPGTVHGNRLTITGNVRASVAGLEACDVFDNKTAQISPLNRITRTNALKDLPDDLYSYVVQTRLTAAQNQALAENFLIEYAHSDLDDDVPNTGVRTDDRFEGDWSQQRVASCDDPSLSWHTDPADVEGGIDEVNTIRMRVVNDHRLGGNIVWEWWTGIKQRETYYGGPKDGEVIPTGAIFANYSRMRSEDRAWSPITYIPGAGYTGGERRTGISGHSTGDRWTVTHAFLKITHHTIDGTIDGVDAVGAAETGTTGSARAGRPVIWQIDASLSGISDSGARAEQVVITELLPAHVSYRDAATRDLDNGTPPTSVEPRSDGTTLLTWVINDLPVNAKIAPRIIVTDLDPFTPDRTNAVSVVSISAPGFVQPRNVHKNEHTVIVRQPGELQLRKSAGRSMDVLNGSQDYTLALRNFSSNLAVEAPIVYEVLSYPRDGSPGAGVGRNPESAFSGSNRLAGAPSAFLLDETTPVPGTFLYTTADPATVPQMLDEDTDPNIWSSTFTPAATAFKFVATEDLAPLTSESDTDSGLVITYTTDQEGNVSGDLYANRFTAFSDSFVRQGSGRHLRLASNQTAVRVVGFSIGDLIWIDDDEDGVYTQGVDTPAPPGVVVSIYRVDESDPPQPAATLAETLVTTALTDGDGRWMVNNLAPGNYRAVISADQFEEGRLLAGLGAAPEGVEDGNDDANEDAGHNGFPGDLGDVRSALITLTYTVGGDGSIRGDEPMGDNVADLPVPPWTTDDFTNLTLDMALFQRPGYTFTKEAIPASGTQVLPGDVVTYGVTGTNTGGTLLAVHVEDDLSAVLEHAAFDPGDVRVEIDGTVVGAPAPSWDAAAQVLSWDGPLFPGQVVTLTYPVTVNPDAWGVEFSNAASSTATPPRMPPIGPIEGSTTHFTPVGPDFTFDKAAVPVTGTQVSPGAVVAYTATGVNTGGTPLLVDVVDDLTDVLRHATYRTGSAVATIGDVPAGTQPGFDPATGLLSWTGEVPVGETVTITYEVLVNADAWGVTFKNVATATATPPVGEPIGPIEGSTTHSTPVVPDFVLTKSANPPSGTTVAPGSLITYRLEVTNTGSTPLDVVVSDDLTEVRRYADVAGIGDGASVVDDTLTWRGRLEPEESAVITYSVRVKPDAWGVRIHNLATATATTPTGGKLTAGPVETQHFTPAVVRQADPSASLARSGTDVTSVAAALLVLLAAGSGLLRAGRLQRRRR